MRGSFLGVPIKRMILFRGIGVPPPFREATFRIAEASVADET